jgi:hypothetical protein
MDSFWVFLLSEKVNPRLSLTDVLDGRVKRYGDIEETDHGQNLSTEHNRRNMARYDALLESDELRFQVKYDVQVSDVTRSGQQSACYIRDMSQNLMKGSAGHPMAEVPRCMNALGIATMFSLAFTQNESLENFLSRSANALRSLYTVAIFVREIVKKYASNALLEDAITTSRETFGFPISGDSVFNRAVKPVETITWQRLQELCGPLDSEYTGTRIGTSDLPGEETGDGSEDEYLEY